MPKPRSREKRRNPVKKLREALALSRQAMAAKFEVSAQSIERYELEIPEEWIRTFSKLARENNLDAIADEIEDFGFVRSGTGAVSRIAARIEDIGDPTLEALAASMLERLLKNYQLAEWPGPVE